MPKPETNRRNIVRRLEAEGWSNEGGGEHDVFKHPTIKWPISVPRHRELSIGVSRSIGKAAGW